MAAQLPDRQIEHSDAPSQPLGPLVQCSLAVVVGRLGIGLARAQHPDQGRGVGMPAACHRLQGGLTAPQPLGYVATDAAAQEILHTERVRLQSDTVQLRDDYRHVLESVLAGRSDRQCRGPRRRRKKKDGMRQGARGCVFDWQRSRLRSGYCVRRDSYSTGSPRS